MKHLKSIVIAIVFLAVGFLLGQSWQLPKAVFNAQTANQDAAQLSPVTYSLNFAENEVTEFQEVAVKQFQTVLDLLTELTTQNNLELATKDYGELGALVTKIGNKENGQDNKYWQYFVNGQKPQVGANNYVLVGGESVEWKFMEDEGF